MALETLKGVKELGGYHVVDMDQLREMFPDKFNESGSMDYKWFEKEIRPKSFIYVRHDKNSLSFTLQNGPVKEAGVNGCQVDSVIEAALLMLIGLDKKHPCKENRTAITALNVALNEMRHRRSDRVERGAEGTDQD